MKDEMKWYTRYIFIFPVALIIILIFGAFLKVLLSTSESRSNTAQDTIEIGAILPLSGDASIAGENTRKGIELAVEQIKDKVTLKIQYEDTMADPKVGVTAVNKLIKYDRVPYIIDDSISPVTLAVAPICERNETVLLATGASAPTISEAGRFVFRIWNSDTLEGETMATYARESLSLNTVAILYINNEFGLGLQQVFTDTFRKMGGTISAIESFEANELQYRTQLTKMINNNPSAIYLVGYSKNCTQVILQAKEFGFSGLWLGTSVMLDEQVTNIVRNAGYKLYYPTPEEPDNNAPNVKRFKDAYTAKYGHAPPPLADVGYDAVMLFVEAAKLSGSYKGENICKGLMKIKGFQGASGLITFDQKGDVHKPIRIVSIDN